MKTKKNFQPIAIGLLENEKNEFKTQSERKYKLFNELMSYIETFATITDKTCLTSHIYEKCVEAIISKYKDEFPPALSASKVMELLDVDTAKIKYLSDEFEQINIELNLENGQVLNEPDFNIYTSSEEENKLYRYLIKTITTIEEGKEYGINIYPANLCQAFYGWISYDWSKGGLVPNISRVKNMERQLG